MTYDELITIIQNKAPSLEAYERVVKSAESASIEDLWGALNTEGIHWIFIPVINKVLQDKVAKANISF